VAQLYGDVQVSGVPGWQHPWLHTSRPLHALRSWQSVDDVHGIDPASHTPPPSVPPPSPNPPGRP
jgi:hypothetical protein